MLSDIINKIPYIDTCKYVYVLFTMSVILIFIYWCFLLLYSNNDDDNIAKNIARKDIFNVKLFSLPFFDNCCSAWPLSHVVLYFIVGFLAPDCWKLTFILGIFWEILEIIMGKIIIGKGGYQGRRKNKHSEVEYSDSWWAGSWKDIVMNFIGLAIGVCLKKMIK